MTYFTIHPSKKLAEFVQCFWILEGHASKCKPFVFRTMANGFPELIFHYKGIFKEILKDQPDSSFVSGIHGQTNIYRDFLIDEDFGIIGVHLFPYVLQPFFGIPALEFTNQLPDLDSIPSTNETHLNERVFGTRCNRERLSVITDFIESRIEEYIRPEIIFAAKKIVDSNGMCNVKDLAYQCCISQRHFERNFKEHTGFSAKSFSRIIRFNALLSKLDYPNKSFTEIALDFGYYDQSHFINDFKAFSGYSPKEYFLNGKA